MNMNHTVIRIATPDNAEEILNIYAPYVEQTAITFEYEVPTLRGFRERITNTLEKYPYLVAVNDGKILGYAYTGAFKDRAAYDWAAETTIYLSADVKHMGLGKKLYQALEGISKAQHITNLNACIAYPEVDDEYLTQNSVQYHEHLGYVMVGKFHKCGYKFERWYNMVWMEKMIGVHPDKPERIIPFSQFSREALASMIDHVNMLA
ncbi:MAG: GNAT family N-acetyltransferase [Hespellia sp.]|nr:GNAT family N-acetyltransferase [Hespellia sp.]